MSRSNLVFFGLGALVVAAMLLGILYVRSLTPQVMVQAHLEAPSIEDCVYDTTVYTWMDENRNGVWEESETPLSGVKVTIDDENEADSLMVGDSGITDGQGRVQLSAFASGCPEMTSYVVVELPLGYEATTPLTQTIDLEGTIVPQFGFRVLSRYNP